MRYKYLRIVMSIVAAMAAVLVILWLMGDISSGISNPALAAPLSLTVTAVDPAGAPNDLDTPIVITGTGFTAVPTVTLGSTELEVTGWASAEQLTATVPWGMEPGIYTLTVENPDTQSGSLPDAFTVTQGIGVWTTGGPYGGDIVDLVLNPMTPTTVYALASGAGVFASYDAAATWEPILLDASPNLLVFDAEDSDVMYFGGEGYLLRTEDGGSTWESISPPGIMDCFYPAAHPISPGVVYVAVSCHPGAPPDFDCGVYRSANYGSTWVTRTNGLTDTHAMAIAFHPENPNKMLVGTRDGNVFLSTDGGKNWDWKAKVSTHIERLYFNPFGAHEAWATTRVNEPPPYLHKSEDPELEVWTPVSVAGGNVVRSLTFLSDTIWAAVSEGFTSTDGGASWSPVSTAGLQPGWREDTSAFAIDPGNTDIIYAGDLGHAMFKSSDGGANWSKMNEGLAAVVPLGLAVTPTDIDTIYAETYALGVLKSSNGGHKWRSLGIGKGGFAKPLAVDPVDPARVYMGDQGSGQMRFQISEDAGDTWHEVTTTLPVTWSGWNTDILEIAPHPTISGTILAGARFLLSSALPDAGTERGAIYASANYGEDWEYTGPTQPISAVYELAYDAVDPNLVYAATKVTGLWKSADGGASWGEVTSFPGDTKVTSVAAHPDVPKTVYVRSEEPPHWQPTLYVSRDAGENWEELPPCDNCGGLLFAPPEREKPPYTLYAGPAWPSGLYSSTDGGYNWEQVEGVPTTDIYSLAAGSDDEQVVIYVGISGGVISPQSQAPAAADVYHDRGMILPAGVYRWGSRLTPTLYFPLVLKAYAP